jgi:hypothetical protein
MQPPTVVAEVDPLAGGPPPEAEVRLIEAPRPRRWTALRPEALTSVLVPRDGPIARWTRDRHPAHGPPASAGRRRRAGAGPTVARCLPERCDLGAASGVDDVLAGILGGARTADPAAVQVTTGPPPR